MLPESVWSYESCFLVGLFAVSFGLAVVDEDRDSN